MINTTIWLDIPVFGNTIQIMYARVTRPLEQCAPWARAIYSKGRLYGKRPVTKCLWPFKDNYSTSINSYVHVKCTCETSDVHTKLLNFRCTCEIRMYTFQMYIRNFRCTCETDSYVHFTEMYTYETSDVAICESRMYISYVHAKFVYH